MVAFPGHIAVAAPVERAWVDRWVPPHVYSAPFGPRFLSALENRLRLSAGVLDAVLLAPPLAGEPPVRLEPQAPVDHPRVARAHRFRTDVQAWTTPSGVLILGRGLGGRWEAAVEVRPDARGHGHGRALALAARHLVPEPGRPVWAQIAPGNASSLRAFLAAGFVPVGSEVLLSRYAD